MGAPTDLGETWNVRFPRQTSENLNAIAVKGSTRVVAVGNRGTIISAQSFVPATAAQDWLLKTSVTTKDLLDVIWSDDQAQFVAVGAGGVALTSADGDTWAAATGITTTDRLNAAAATSAQNLVIVGATNTGAGVVYTSSNKGTAFTRRLVVGATSFSDVVWTGTKIVAACANKVFISTDGITWTSKPLASTTPTSLAFVSGKLVLIGSKSWQSSDAGTTWVSITVPTSDMTLNTVGTELIGANNRGEVWSSSDAGNSWQTRLIPQNIQFNAATRFGTDYVVVGEGGVIVNSTGIAAGEWIQKQVSPVTQDLTSVTANGPGNTATQAVAVGLGGKIIVASAFNSWAAATSITPFVASDLLKVIWSPSGYVAVGADGTIVTSNDGLAWTSKTISADKLTGVAWDGSKFVAVGVNTTGQGVVWSSTDAVHWTKNLTTFHLGNGTITAPPFTDLCWSSSAAQFRASAKDFALYSDDGLSWTARALTPGTQATSATPEGVISGNRAFRRSNDQWVSLPLPTVLPAATVIRHIEPDDKGADFVGLSPAGAIWFSVGYRGTAPPVWDDQNWQIQSNVQNLSLTDAVFFDSHVVLVGAKGTIETFTKPATDARTWRGLSSVGNSVAWNGKSGADALYVAVGWDMTWTGVLASGAASQSNIDWTPHRQGSTTRLFSAVQITYAVDPLKTNGLFVAVGGSIWTSPNGIDWTEKVSGPGADPSIYTVTRMGTTLFAFGYNNSQKQIYQATSTDYGVTWSGFIPVTGPIGTVNQPGFQWAMLAAAKAAGDFYLTVGWSGHYMVSSTGTATDWHEGILKLSYPKEDFTSVAWADGVNRYVITTNYGGFWSFDGNQFVKGTVWKSDGLGSWVKTSDGQGSHSVWAIKYVAGEFVAVGNAGFLWKSFNGIDWREYAPYETGGSGTPNYLYDLTFANTVPVNVGDPSDKVLVAVGGLGTIITTSGAKVPNQATITFTPNASSFSEKAGSVQFTAEISDRVFPGTLTLPLSHLHQPASDSN